MLCLIVAEDVSLTGGPALQRIRLVAEVDGGGGTLFTG